MSENPELDGYEPTGGLSGRRIRRASRFVVIAAIASLILPGIVITIGYAERTADIACARWVEAVAVNAARSDARFEVFGHAGPGWQCYAVAGNGAERPVAPLGLFPAIPPPAPRHQIRTRSTMSPRKGDESATGE